MIKFLLVLIMLPLIVFAQKHKWDNVIKVSIRDGNVNKDSLTIMNSDMSPDFYNKQNSESNLVMNNKTQFANNYVNPQLYFLFFKSDVNHYFSRPGFIFLDATTDSIIVDYKNPYLSYANGKSSTEYRNKFLPFLSKNLDFDSSSKYHASIRWDSTELYDTIIYNYTKTHNSSYVALWLLVDRFSNMGYANMREKTLNLFSPKIKKTKTWQVLYNKLGKSLVKEGHLFPKLSLEDTTSNKKILNLNKSYKYTLIDFWFSRCKPCLAQISYIKQLYNKDHPSNKLDVISISTDNSMDRKEKLWEKRLQQLGMNWPQYMDENATIASSAYIIEFPTNFLIDQNGYVIKKNISLADLDKLLK
ncbi:TlpA family protein disulfide reductase [Rhizosphaericola mali]|uniref:TlpA family protein disulfide reductase n=1 Tax=Rhizosphaericola mali TaxID=2545455 RepID=A0A5P2FW72_9BACT|nr:TlpA disulfide reductase family protein [Rhizosphaericola mali]QES87415.1 TlpA family protein disulfide reductase [Rhizosphaericola mali]